MEYKVKIARKDNFEGRLIAKAISYNIGRGMVVELSDYSYGIKTGEVFEDCQVYIDGEDVRHYDFVRVINAVNHYIGKCKGDYR